MTIMNVIELSDAIGDEQRALDALIRRLRDEQVAQPAAGTWLVKDVLGHLAVYSDVERRALAAGLGRAEKHPIYFDDREQWNEQQLEANRDRTASRIIDELQVNGARYLALVKSLYEEDLIKRIRFPWSEEGTVHELIVEGLAHRRAHRQELMAALAQRTD